MAMVPFGTPGIDLNPRIPLRTNTGHSEQNLDLSPPFLNIEPIWHLLRYYEKIAVLFESIPMTYSSSLTNEEWKILEPLLPEILPPKKQTSLSKWSKREIVIAQLI
jgi:hypothetical protein